MLAVCPNSSEIWIYEGCHNPDSSTWTKKWVLTEHDLPGGLSGCALASWYTTAARAVGRTRAPVVVISADAPEPDYEQFGVDSWLQRPLSTACIAEMLCAACISGVPRHTRPLK